MPFSIDPEASNNDAAGLDLVEVDDDDFRTIWQISETETSVIVIKKKKDPTTNVWNIQREYVLHWTALWHVAGIVYDVVVSQLDW